MNAWLNYVGCGLIALSALACGSKGEDDGGDDETGGTGGTSGSSTGGTSSGGTSSGGTSTGGTSTGGTAGSGTGGTGTLPPMTTMSFDDPSDVCPNPPAMNMANCWKLVDTNADMTTSTPIPADEITYEHITDDGDPDPGAFQATIPYTEASQWVSFGINFDPVDMTNRVIRARVKIVSGIDGDIATAPAGTKVYAKSGMGYCYANGEYFPQSTAGEWVTIQYDLTRDPGYTDPNCTVAFDPSDVRELGIQFDSNSAAMSPETGVVLIDNVQY